VRNSESVVELQLSSVAENLQQILFFGAPFRILDYPDFALLSSYKIFHYSVEQYVTSNRRVVGADTTFYFFQLYDRNVPRKVDLRLALQW